jgi:hypothetical protein
MWEAIGIVDRGACVPAGLGVRDGRHAGIVLVTAGASGVARLKLQLACHRHAPAFLPVAPGQHPGDVDGDDVLARLDRVRGRSVVALELPGAPMAAEATGAAWLRARQAALQARRDDLSALVDLSRTLPHEDAVFAGPPGGPVALLLTRTEACGELGAAAHQGWRDVVVSAPWPVFGFAGAEQPA